MSTQPISARRGIQRAFVWLLAYLAFYLVASAADLVTTDLALLTEGAREANSVIAEGGVYSAARAWGLTAVGGAVMAATFLFALRHAERVSERWLVHPMRSFAIVYVNPWACRVIDRSPLHMMSLAIALPVLRLLASGNNLLIWWDRPGPLGWAANELAKLTTPLVGFMLAVGSVYFLLAVLLAPLGVVLLRRYRGQ